MNQNAEKTPTRTAEGALQRLLEAETWAECFSEHRQDPRRLADKAGRFRAALVGMGETDSEAEVRHALLKHAGLDSEAPSVGVPEAGGRRVEDPVAVASADDRLGGEDRAASKVGSTPGTSSGSSARRPWRGCGLRPCDT